MTRSNDVRRQVAAIVVLAGLATAGTAYAQPDPIEIMNRVQDLYRGDSSHGEMTMEIVTEHWSRSITMEMWSYGEDHTLARILSPARESGRREPPVHRAGRDSALSRAPAYGVRTVG